MLREKRERETYLSMKFAILKGEIGNSVNTKHEKKNGREQWHVPLKPYASYL